MKNYRLLKSCETIQVGDEYRTITINWTPLVGRWDGRTLESLQLLTGPTGKVRRKVKKKVKNKTCVSWI